MSERSWNDIGNEIRDDYLRADGSEDINFREVQWDVWLAEVEREAAARALESEADRIYPGPTASTIIAGLRARVAEIRERPALAPVREEGDKE